MSEFLLNDREEKKLSKTQERSPGERDKNEVQLSSGRRFNGFCVVKLSHSPFSESIVLFDIVYDDAKKKKNKINC